jgi:hypothetical protein
VAATSLHRPTAHRWGRPLPGRDVEVAATTVVHGGDVGPGRVVARQAVVDERGRVAIGAAP